jgi:hypothetical protein
MYSFVNLFSLENAKENRKKKERIGNKQTFCKQQ